VVIFLDETVKTESAKFYYYSHFVPGTECYSNPETNFETVPFSIHIESFVDWFDTTPLD